MHKIAPSSESFGRRKKLLRRRRRNRNVYGPLSDVLRREKCETEERDEKKFEAHLREWMRTYVPPHPPAADEDDDVTAFGEETDVFDESVGNLVELRRVKEWAKYMLSDGVVRYGTVHRHPLYNACPGWLVDVLHRRREAPELALVWCTDVRGVDHHLGGTCSLINLHHLFRRLERGGKSNFTAIVAHLTVLSTAALNPINRRGMKYPASGVTARTFEDVKRSLESTRTAKEEIRDDLEAFLTRIMLVLPHRVGTNSFDVMMR